MLTQDDITAFSEANADALEAANEYARRAAKGLPADRYTDGTQGARLVAQGIAAYQRILHMQTAAILNMLDAARQAGDDAVQIHSDHSKYR